ncbi:type IV pilus assembly protein PilM [Candidatus Parcubacteria bacterium]|nr:type IV pilus assembly protein PilM [Candidatus Parcubacteria bacterium]
MALFSNIFKKDDPRALGVDIGSSAIKIVQLRKKNGQAVLETYGELALGPYAGVTIGQAVQLPPDKLSTALSDLMKEKEVNVTTRRCGVSIPFSSSLMSVIEMPEVSLKQLAVMVPIEARKYIPVPIAEVTLDWSVIPKSQLKIEEEDANDSMPIKAVPKMEVLTVAIHKQTLSHYQDIITTAGLEPGFFEIEIFSTMRSVLDQGLKPMMIMDMGAASTKLYIMERGIVRASHTINRGSQDITSTLSRSLGMTPEQAEILKRSVGASGEDPKVTEAILLVLDYIFAEVNSVLVAFEKKHNQTVAKAILVGGGSALKGLANLAKDSFKTEVEAGMPFNKVAAPAFLENILKETGPEFAVAIGLALRKLADEG